MSHLGGEKLDNKKEKRIRRELTEQERKKTKEKNIKDSLP